jgi:hypothetical protein
MDEVTGLASSQIALYCSFCEAAIPNDRAVDGPIQDLPHCPVHQEHPLTIRPATLCASGLSYQPY